MNYHTIVVNNFFDDPYKIIELSKTQTYYFPQKDIPNQGWLGSRSENLKYNFVIDKVLSYYFSSKVKYQSEIFFHKSSFIKQDKKSYIHRDISHQIAGLIYLNDTNDINSGTTLYDENFNESLITSNRFNTMICYDSKQFHGPTSLDVDRLTMPFFINLINE